MSKMKLTYMDTIRKSFKEFSFKDKEKLASKIIKIINASPDCTFYAIAYEDINSDYLIDHNGKDELIQMVKDMVNKSSDNFSVSINEFDCYSNHSDYCKVYYEVLS